MEPSIVNCIEESSPLIGFCPVSSLVAFRPDTFTLVVTGLVEELISHHNVRQRMRCNTLTARKVPCPTEFPRPGKEIACKVPTVQRVPHRNGLSQRRRFANGIRKRGTFLFGKSVAPCAVPPRWVAALHALDQTG